MANMNSNGDYMASRTPVGKDYMREYKLERQVHSYMTKLKKLKEKLDDEDLTGSELNEVQEEFSETMQQMQIANEKRFKRAVDSTWDRLEIEYSMKQAGADKSMDDHLQEV